MNLLPEMAEYLFDLPPELVAQEPPAERGRSRLMLLDRRASGPEARLFDDLPELLPDGALLVFNNVRVSQARLLGRRTGSGGQVEAAIVAGDSIGESGWTIWVREGSICHSACVFVLAAGDNRLISGKVGIHRMMRISSTATSRAELNKELHEVYDNVKDYLQRNGVAVGVADLMMTVPNRSLRLLTQDELRQYGLDGTNAVQDDLELPFQIEKRRCHRCQPTGLESVAQFQCR